MTNTANNTTIAGNAVLVNLSIRTWSAHTMDKGVSQKVATEHGTDKSMGRFWKTLVDKNKGTALGAIYATEREARKFHYDNTLPWMSDGERILPVENYDKYVSKMRELEGQMEKQVFDFLEQYPDIIEQMREKLKSLFDESNYPTRERLVNAFSLSYRIMPLPQSSTFFETKLTDIEIERAKRNLESNLQDAAQRANEDLWGRLYECVSKLQERLGGDEKYLREGAIDNAKELLNLMTRLNVTKDNQLESLRAKLEDTFEGISAQTLRTDKVLRDQKMDEVNAIESMMSTLMMGGAPMNLGRKNVA